MVDIKGTLKGGSPAEAGCVNSVAFRSDIDALPIPEDNQAPPYVTKTKFAHMCGPDGHIACLMAAAEMIIKNRNKIRDNQFVRLLFQPAEEGPGGAEPMIKEGCLDYVDEVYGIHNIPSFIEG